MDGASGLCHFVWRRRRARCAEAPHLARGAAASVGGAAAAAVECLAWPRVAEAVAARWRRGGVGAAAAVAALRGVLCARHATHLKGLAATPSQRLLIGSRLWLGWLGRGCLRGSSAAPTPPEPRPEACARLPRRPRQATSVRALRDAPRLAADAARHAAPVACRAARGGAACLYTGRGDAPVARTARMAARKGARADVRSAAERAPSRTHRAGHSATRSAPWVRVQCVRTHLEGFCARRGRACCRIARASPPRVPFGAVVCFCARPDTARFASPPPPRRLVAQ